jgi:methionyl-tRNA formyltransferase
MLKIAILASGGLGFDTLQKVSKHDISFVMTDKKSKETLSFCNKNKIPCYVGNPRNKEAALFYNRFVIDVIVSINYIFIIDKKLISHPKLLAFNLHGSLLPKYRGRTPHVWSIINGEKETGVTAHVLDEGCDTGDIIKQVKVEILDDDSGGSILEKISKLYYPIINEVLIKAYKGQLTYEPQDNSLATFFGKRSPDDGKIHWSWHKERILNWVRAQAYPYPGAFAYINGVKIIIDKISYSNAGFVFDNIDGKVLQSHPKILIKVPNGVVQIDKLRNPTDKAKITLGICFT